MGSSTSTEPPRWHPPPENLLSLPIELQKNIFSTVTPADLFSLLRVCSVTNVMLVQDNSVWFASLFRRPWTPNLSNLPDCSGFNWRKASAFLFNDDHKRTKQGPKAQIAMVGSVDYQQYLEIACYWVKGEYEQKYVSLVGATYLEVENPIPMGVSVLNDLERFSPSWSPWVTRSSVIVWAFSIDSSQQQFDLNLQFTLIDKVVPQFLANKKRVIVVGMMTAVLRHAGMLPDRSWIELECKKRNLPYLEADALDETSCKLLFNAVVLEVVKSKETFYMEKKATQNPRNDRP